MYEKVVVKVPGKLFIAGEYAVTRPRGLSLVAAVETDFSVTISESDDRVSQLHTNVAIPDETFNLEHFSGAGHGWEFVSKVIKIMNIGTYPEIRIDIESPLGFGENKKGYGSSACVVVGLAKALNIFYHLGLSLDDIYKKAGEAHYRVQGSGSLGDVAAITYGGIIFYRSGKRSTVVQHSGLYTDFSGFEIKPVSLPQDWQAYVVQTGKAAKTGEKLKIEFSADFYEQSDELVIELATALDLQDFALFKEKLIQNQLLLLEHVPEGYMTQKLALALNLVNAQENLVGKISGAGFGENMIVFAKNEKGISEIQEELAKNDIVFEKIRISETF